ncbi:hypothetical protein BYT27DRAFT_7213203 [Phlegmacium glaucopus]|nr:hypothetical protein BYT27DRAFT_7213203 [Phlegmacium glaucopus]
MVNALQLAWQRTGTPGIKLYLMAKKYALDPLFCEKCSLLFGSLTVFEAVSHVNVFFAKEGSEVHLGSLDTSNLDIIKLQGTMSQQRFMQWSVTPPKALTTYTASKASFNGSAYKYYLCTKTFRTLQGLNAHLNLAAHEQ